MNSDGLLVLVLHIGKNPSLFEATEEMFKKHNLKNIWKDTVVNATAKMRTVEGCTELLKQASYEIEYVHTVDTDTTFYDKFELVSFMFGTMTANWNINSYSKQTILYECRRMDERIRHGVY